MKEDLGASGCFGAGGVSSLGGGGGAELGICSAGAHFL